MCVGLTAIYYNLMEAPELSGQGFVLGLQRLDLVLNTQETGRD